MIHASPQTPAQKAESDKWTWMIADWYNVPCHLLTPAYLSPASGGNEPTPDAYVVNNLFDKQYFISASRSSAPVLIKVINSAAFSMYQISVDGIPLQIVEIDGQPVEPLELPYFNLNVAQRVSFYLDFSKLDLASVGNSDSIYFRVQGIPEMYPTYDPSNNVTLGVIGSSTGEALNMLWRGVINFGAKGSLPTYSTAPTLSTPPPLDTNLLQARPTQAVAAVAPAPTLKMNLLVQFYADPLGVNRPHVNGYTFETYPGSIQAPLTHQYLSTAGGPIMIPNIVNGVVMGSGKDPFVIPYGAVVEVFVNNTDGGEHPFHLHGHPVWLVATSDYPEAETLYANNYLYRDVVSIPAVGEPY